MTENAKKFNRSSRRSTVVQDTKESMRVLLKMFLNEMMRVTKGLRGSPDQYQVKALLRAIQPHAVRKLPSFYFSERLSEIALHKICNTRVKLTLDKWAMAGSPTWAGSWAPLKKTQLTSMHFECTPENIVPVA